MTDWEELVRLLDEREIVLSSSGGQLAYQAPPGAVDDRLRALVRPLRPRLLATLTADGAAEAAAPAGVAQQRMHRGHGRVADPSLWNITLRITLRGALAPPLLADALTALVGRHQSLRTGFDETDLGLLQQVLPATPIALPVTDLTAAPAAEIEAAVHAEAGTPFDLTRPPLLRARLLHLGPDHWTLLLTLHHIAVDGWSLATLLTDLGALYRSPGPLAPEAGRMTDHACWERTVVTRATVRQATEHWASTLDGLPLTVDLPTDRPRPPQRSGHGGVLPFRLPTPLADALTAYARRHSTTPSAVVLAALGELLGRLTGADEVLVMLAHANRTRREHEHLVGLLTYNLPIRLTTRADNGFPALVTRTGATLADALDHAAVPFGLLTEPLRDAGLSLPPSFPQVLLVVQSTPEPTLDLPGLDTHIEDIPGTSARSDLLLMLTPDPNGLAGLAEYDADLFDPTTVQTWLDELVNRLAARLLPDRGTA